MDIVLLVGSIVGNKTRTAITEMESVLRGIENDIVVTTVDLGELDIQFSDGRHYFEYNGDTKYLTETLMQADGIIIGTPTFQASIPGTLKNVFDLLPIYAFRDKVVGVLVTAGTPKHYLMVEQQLKPILSYMKANVLSEYVFIEEQDFHQQKITNYDTQVRLKKLGNQLIEQVKATQWIKERVENEFDF